MKPAQKVMTRFPIDSDLRADNIKLILSRHKSRPVCRATPASLCVRSAPRWHCYITLSEIRTEAHS